MSWMRRASRPPNAPAMVAMEKTARRSAGSTARNLTNGDAEVDLPLAVPAGHEEGDAREEAGLGDAEEDAGREEAGEVLRRSARVSGRGRTWTMPMRVMQMPQASMMIGSHIEGRHAFMTIWKGQPSSRARPTDVGRDLKQNVLRRQRGPRGVVSYTHEDEEDRET